MAVPRSLVLTLAWVICTGCVLSFLGSSFIIITHFSKRRLPKSFDRPEHNMALRFNKRMVAYISLADVVLAVSLLYSQVLFFKSSILPTFVCYSSAVMVYFSQLSSILWAFSYATNIFFQIVLPLRLKNWWISNIRTIEVLFHAISWGLPAASCIGIGASRKFGPTFIGCWIEGNSRLQIYLFYVPLFLTFIFISVAYIVVMAKVWQNKRNSAKYGNVRASESRLVSLKLTFYILIFIVCWAPAIAGTIHNQLAPDQLVPWLLIVQFLFFPLQGFFNGIIYGMNKERWLLVRDALQRPLMCCLRKKPQRVGVEIDMYQQM